MTPTEKKLLFMYLIEHKLRQGYDITDYLFKPMSYFDWDKIKATVKQLNEEYESDSPNYYA